MSASVRETRNVDHLIASLIAAHERHSELRANEHTHVLADNSIVRCIETHSDSTNVVEAHVSYVHSNAVQAAKRHRARHRDAAKRHTEQSQITRARFESHDVAASTFSVATTQRALSDETRVSERDAQLERELRAYDAQRMIETEEQRAASVADARLRAERRKLQRKRRAARNAQSAHERARLEHESRL